MIRIEVYRFTGAKAENTKVATRLRRKIRGAIGSGHTVLVDFEDVQEITADFAEALVPQIDESKTKIVGLLADEKRDLGFP